MFEMPRRSSIKNKITRLMNLDVATRDCGVAVGRSPHRTEAPYSTMFHLVGPPRNACADTRTKNQEHEDELYLCE